MTSEKKVSQLVYFYTAAWFLLTIMGVYGTTYWIITILLVLYYMSFYIQIKD